MPSEQGSLELSVTVGDASFSASGETQVVLDVYADFKEFVRVTPAPPARPTPAKAAVVTQEEPESAALTEGAHTEVKAPTTLPLKPYLARLKLRGNKEKTTAIIAWSAESGGKPALTVGEVEQLWKKAPFRAPSNLPRDIRSAEAEGWLDREGKSGSSGATYRINGYGEDIVAGWAKSEE